MSEVADLSARRWAANGDPEAQSPLTALAEARRQLEAGEIEAEHVIIIYGHIDESGASQTGYFQAGTFNEFGQVGLVQRGLRLISEYESE